MALIVGIVLAVMAVSGVAKIVGDVVGSILITGYMLWLWH
jgi:hypothetical protein